MVKQDEWALRNVFALIVESVLGQSRDFFCTAGNDKEKAEMAAKLVSKILIEKFICSDKGFDVKVKAGYGEFWDVVAKPEASKTGAEERLHLRDDKKGVKGGITSVEGILETLKKRLASEELKKINHNRRKDGMGIADVEPLPYVLEELSFRKLMAGGYTVCLYVFTDYNNFRALKFINDSLTKPKYLLEVLKKACAELGHDFVREPHEDTSWAATIASKFSPEPVGLAHIGKRHERIIKKTNALAVAEADAPVAPVVRG